MSENSNSKSKPPRYNGKGGRDFVVFGIHFKAWLHTQGIGEVLDLNFESTLPTAESDRTGLLTEAAGADATVAAAAKKRLRALDANSAAVYGLILALQTDDMLNKVTLQQSLDSDWTIGKFPSIWKEICDEENPKDEMAEMDMEDELREIKLGKNSNPKEILRDMASIEAKFKLTIPETKKAAFVLRIGKNEYKTSMATTGNNIRRRADREATAKELIEEMYREW